MSVKKIELTPIGKVHVDDIKMEYWIEIEEHLRPGLKELDKFSHLNVIWWADKCDNPKQRKILQIEELPFFYGDKVPKMGVFATRSEYRPNPIAITATSILKIDYTKGIIIVGYLDAMDGSPILDLKPYIKMSDFIKSATYPDYLEHWPKNYESAGSWFAEMMQNSHHK